MQRLTIDSTLVDTVEDFSVDVLRVGDSCDDWLISQVRTLFKDSYHAYHYVDEALSSSRLRLVLKHGPTVVGYCTIHTYPKIAYLSNLVVRPEYRGTGLGTILERRRALEYTSMGLTPYVSCVTVGTQSQRAKISLGLKRMNIKCGYRVGVFSTDDVSSAATYGGSIRDVEPIEIEFETIVHEQQKRIRFCCGTERALIEAISNCRQYENFYADVLCPRGMATFANSSALLKFCGIDVHLERQQYGVLFQVKNDRYRLGVDQGLDLAEPAREYNLAEAQNFVNEWTQ